MGWEGASSCYSSSVVPSSSWCASLAFCILQTCCVWLVSQKKESPQNNQKAVLKYRKLPFQLHDLEGHGPSFPPWYFRAAVSLNPILRWTISVRSIHTRFVVTLWHSSRSSLRWDMLMAIYIHQLGDKIICHDIISAGLQAKAPKGCSIFGTDLRENILPECCRAVWVLVLLVLVH